MDQHSTTNKITFLWTTRRTLSMAFHRAIYQLDGIKHFCEPFALPHYFGPDRRSVQFADNQEVAERFDQIPTHAEQLHEITRQHGGYHSTFIKEHAMYTWPDIVSDTVLRKSVHTFLVRNPDKAIKSVYRQTLVDFQESVWSHVVPEELGFREQLLLYERIRDELQLPVLVIDADDLMRNPRQLLQKYCTFVGLEFTDAMLDWSNDGTKTEAKPWDFLPNSWIKDVKETNGFRNKDKSHDDDGIEYPQFILDAIQDNLRYYNELWKHRLIVD